MTLGQEIQQAFWKGFNRHQSIGRIWLERMEDLLLLRLMAVYCVLNMKWNVKNLSDEDLQFYQDIRRQVAAGKPDLTQFLNPDFAR